MTCHCDLGTILHKPNAPKSAKRYETNPLFDKQTKGRNRYLAWLKGKKKTAEEELGNNNVTVNVFFSIFNAGTLVLA